MIDGENKQKHYEFIKSLGKKSIRKKNSSLEIMNENEEEKNHQILNQEIYNQDLILHSRAMIKKKKYF